METLSFYSHEEITQILTRSARLLEVDLSQAVLREVALRSRGTPRVANRLLKRLRDYVVHKDMTSVTTEGVKKVMELLEMDDLGLDPLDRKYLTALAIHFPGRASRH